MIRFTGRIVQFGFGAVGKSFYEKVAQEIKYDEKEYFVITRAAGEFHDYINLGGLVDNFISREITKENFQAVFKTYLRRGDLLIDFADTVGTSEICDWCAEENIMYINTGTADWPEKWLNINQQDSVLRVIKEKHQHQSHTNQHPIVLQHGNNPGLVSHFVKAGIDYIVQSEYKKDKQIKALLMQNKYNEVAQYLAIKMIHVNDIDLQKIKDPDDDTTLVNTWCADTFFFEMLSEATVSLGSHETIDVKDVCKMSSRDGFLELNNIAVDKKCRTYYPGGMFEGYLVPHEETITIAKGLEVLENNTVVYRPSVMFIYTPSDLANRYLLNSKVNDYPIPDPKKPSDCENENGLSIIRGHTYPQKSKMVYKEDIVSGTEYVGVLILGDHFNPVWVGNRVECSFLYKKAKNSYWQTPTITPVAMSALAAVCWMIKNKDKGGIYFPENIIDYQYILKIAEKYISKTIYKTFTREEIEETLKLDLSNLSIVDSFIE